MTVCSHILLDTAGLVFAIVSGVFGFHHDTVSDGVHRMRIEYPKSVSDPEFNLVLVLRYPRYLAFGTNSN